MPITALGYMGIRARSLGDWADYAGRLLGMQQVDHGGGSLAFRMDDWRQRFVIMDEPGDELAFMGWQVSNTEELDDLGARLESAGVEVTEAGRDLCDCLLYTSDAADE